MSYAAGIPASVISPFGAGAAPTREFKAAAVGGPVGAFALHECAVGLCRATGTPTNCHTPFALFHSYAVQKRRKGQVTAMEDIDPLNRYVLGKSGHHLLPLPCSQPWPLTTKHHRYRPTTLPFIDPKEKLRQQVKKEVVEPKGCQPCAPSQDHPRDTHFSLFFPLLFALLPSLVEMKFRLDDPVLDKELEDILKLAEEETPTDAAAEAVQVPHLVYTSSPSASDQAI